MREVFTTFLGLGLTSFGGPVAHLGYFRTTFVERRRWLTDRAYADLVALCQFLPGPASSQVGMAIGLHRAGMLGLLAAFLAFTLPSAVILVAFAFGMQAVGVSPDAGWLAGLKAAAVAVVAHAVLGMAKNLAVGRERATIAVAGMILALLIPNVYGQVGVIVLAGLAGLAWLRPASPEHDGHEGTGVAGADQLHVRLGRRAGSVCFGLFLALLALLPVLAGATESGAARLADSFYRAGALVFGGGHVVLPLLQAETAGLVAREDFLAGYGAAQAVPGPLFTFAGYLGASTEGAVPGGLAGASIALLAIFLPGALILLAALPYWEALRRAPLAQRTLAGVNAGVVGLLAAALYDPVFTAGVLAVDVPVRALAIAVAAFVALSAWKAPAWAVVIAAALLGWAVL
ncbi:chromate transporter [Bogoriella caseilytica]|uniref:Chromate transporter n=1 Tax=Bogoriella caseilytica TaxID=56055 RepID=A0A3N2BC09_9MICO|nr:chromate transporter [Bogoriella caseilytica]